MSIIESIKDNWTERPLSEKIILLVVGVFTIVCLFYLLVVDSLVSWREHEAKKLVANQKIYAQVSRLVTRFEQQNNTENNVSSGLATIIDESLQANGLAMRGFQPGKNNDARLRLSDVSYDALMQWLYDIEYKHHMTIEEISIAQTKTAGVLTANVRVRQ
jgi:general secretion pathway protein M